MAIPITLEWDQYIYDKLSQNTLRVGFDGYTNMVRFHFLEDDSTMSLTSEDYTERYRWLVEEAARQTKEEVTDVQEAETDSGERSEGVC